MANNFILALVGFDISNAQLSRTSRMSRLASPQEAIAKRSNLLNKLKK